MHSFPFIRWSALTTGLLMLALRMVEHPTMTWFFLSHTELRLPLDALLTEPQMHRQNDIDFNEMTSGDQAG
jgi:hypothetical protein